MLKTQIKVAAVSGVPTYLAARYVFDASNKTAIVAAVIVAAIGLGLISISFPVPTNQTIPNV